MCGGKKKKRKRMIRQMLNWNTDVVLAYNGRYLRSVGLELPQLAYLPKLIKEQKD